MRNFDVNPTVLDGYRDLYEGERVYRVSYGTINEAYAIREGGEEMEDFEYEVRSALRRKHGRHILGSIREFEDVTELYRNEDGDEI